MTEPEILMQDDSLIAASKPAGMPVVPAPGSGTSLVDWVRSRAGAAAAAAHRLDEEASGAVLMALGKESLDFLSGQFQSKTARREFLALVVVGEVPGIPRGVSSSRGADGLLADAFEVDLPLGPNAHRPGTLRPTAGRDGRPALTQVRVLERFGRFCWVSCVPLAGRPHQVRAHLAACGAPVLNDATYGDPSALLLLSDLKRGYKGRDHERPILARLALHASSIRFVHPASRGPALVSATLPRDLELALRQLRRYAGPIGRRGRRPSS